MQPEVSSPRNWWRALVLVICLAVESSLLWFNYEGRGSLRHGWLLTVLSLTLLFALTSTAVLPVPKGVRIPFFGVWPRLSDSIKAGVSILLIFLWTPAAKLLVPDSVLGVILILAPDALFLLAALVYLSNGLSRSDQPKY
jgi:hypothetical protein